VSVVRTLEQFSFQAASKNVQWLRRLHCSTHELQLNWTHGHHQWSRVRCEERRAWPTTTSVDAAGNQRCSPVGAGRWGNAAPCCADIGKQELPTERWYVRALAAIAVPWATVTRDRTSDVGKLVTQLHLASTVACQAERQAVLPVWRCRSLASWAPMPRLVYCKTGSDTDRRMLRSCLNTAKRLETIFSTCVRIIRSESR